MARETLPSGVIVSTVFTRTDLALGTGAPLLFVTTVIGGPHNLTCRLYSTWAEAEAGHAPQVEEALRAVPVVFA